MEAPRYYLDTSAYLAVILGEDGAEELSRMLARGNVLSSVLLPLDAGRHLVRLSREQRITAETVAAIFKGQQYVLTSAGFGRLQSEVSQFAVRLEQSGLFDGVNMTHQRREHFREDSAIAFHVECRI